MKFISFFAGIGGIDLGLERAGHTCVGQVEIDPYCNRVLAKHWPDVPRWGDIRKVDPDELPEADLYVGGFPCKQTSLAAAIHGKRTGLRGPESGLWIEYWLRIRHRMPRWVLIENVSGVEAWSTEITESLERVGYTVSELKLSAVRVGAPHLRRRVFFAANLDGKRLEVPRAPGPSAIVGEPWRTPPRDLWREVEPGVWRMASRVSHRVDRLRALGNAVVPQVAEFIGRMLMEADA